MNLSDIIAFAKAGYSVADVKELLSLPSEQHEEPIVDTIEKPIENAPEESVQPIEAPIDNTNNANASIDYKQLYEETKKQLQAAQLSNVNTNIEGNNEADLSELIKSFM